MPVGSGNQLAKWNGWITSTERNLAITGANNADSATLLMKGVGKDFRSADYIDYLQ